MNSVERTLQKHPFVTGMAPADVAHLCAVARLASFNAGEVILKQREPADSAYLITSGKVIIEVHSRATHRNVFIDTLEDGDVLGWSWLFAPFCWHFQATAVEPTETIALDGAALLVRCEEDHEFGYALTKRVTHLLVRRLEAMRRTVIRLDNPQMAAPQPAGG